MRKHNLHLPLTVPCNSFRENYFLKRRTVLTYPPVIKLSRLLCRLRTVPYDVIRRNLGQTSGNLKRVAVPPAAVWKSLI